jgi:hypothetical protein
MTKIQKVRKEGRKEERNRGRNEGRKKRGGWVGRGTFFGKFGTPFFARLFVLDFNHEAFSLGMVARFTGHHDRDDIVRAVQGQPEAPL